MWQTTPLLLFYTHAKHSKLSSDYLQVVPSDSSCNIHFFNWGTYGWRQSELQQIAKSQKLYEDIKAGTYCPLLPEATAGLDTAFLRRNGRFTELRERVNTLLRAEYKRLLDERCLDHLKEVLVAATVPVYGSRAYETCSPQKIIHGFVLMHVVSFGITRTILGES